MAIQETDFDKQFQADWLTYIVLAHEIESRAPIDPTLLERGFLPLVAAAIAEGIETEVIWGDGEHEVFNASVQLE